MDNVYVGPFIKFNRQKKYKLVKKYGCEECKSNEYNYKYKFCQIHGTPLKNYSIEELTCDYITIDVEKLFQINYPFYSIFVPTDYYSGVDVWSYNDEFVELNGTIIDEKIQKFKNLFAEEIERINRVYECTVEFGVVKFSI